MRTYASCTFSHSHQILVLLRIKRSLWAESRTLQLSTHPLAVGSVFCRGDSCKAGIASTKHTSNSHSDKILTINQRIFTDGTQTNPLVHASTGTVDPVQHRWLPAQGGQRWDEMC